MTTPITTSGVKQKPMTQLRKTVVIGMENIGRLNQFLMMPATFTRNNIDFRVITIDGEFANTDAFDLVIRGVANGNSTTKSMTEHFTKVNDKVIYLERLLKDAQQEALTAAVYSYSENVHTFGNYYALGGLLVDSTGRFKAVSHLPENIGGRLGYVFKPTGGARSIGIMQFPASTNIRLFVQRFMQQRDSFKTMSDVIELVNSFGGKLNVGTSNFKDESLDFIKDPSTQWIIQNAAPSNIVELRVLKSGNGKLLVSKRDHLSETTNGFETVFNGLTDSDLVTELNAHGAAKAKSERLEGIEHFIQSCYFPMSHGSIDLWLDVSGHEMQWGTFEYQPQFGHSFIDDTTLTEFLKDSITNMYCYE